MRTNPLHLGHCSRPSRIVIPTLELADGQSLVGRVARAPEDRRIVGQRAEVSAVSRFLIRKRMRRAVGSASGDGTSTVLRDSAAAVPAWLISAPRSAASIVSGAMSPSSAGAGCRRDRWGPARLWVKATLRGQVSCSRREGESGPKGRDARDPVMPLPGGSLSTQVDARDRRGSLSRFGLDR